MQKKSGTLFFGLLLSVGILIIDLLLPLGVAGGVPYVAVVLLTIWLPGKQYTVYSGLFASVLTIAGYFLSPEGGIEWMILTNRFLALFGIWTAVFVLIKYKISEEHARQHKERLDALFKHATEGIILSDTKGNILMINPEAEKQFGYDAGELLGQPVEQLIPQNLKAVHSQHRQEYYTSPRTRPMGKGMEILGQRKDGSVFPADISLSRFYSKEGLIVVSFVTDITERKKQETDLKNYARKLEESNKELEQFAYVASHDLQEPLRMVASYTQLLEKRFSDKLGEDGKEFIRFAVDGATRMKTLLNDLLDYSRVGTRAKPFKKISGKKVLDNVLVNLSQRIKENDAVVDVCNMPDIVADESQLTQLFQNLIGNALKFRKEDQPEVKVKCRELKNEWEFTVQDNGIGIDPKFDKKIFLIFQRLHNREDYEGSGIGLAICKKIVERHGGQIRFESEPGKGTSFIFTLSKKASLAKAA